MNGEEIFFSWIMYGELVKFGVFSNIFLNQINGMYPWLM